MIKLLIGHRGTGKTSLLSRIKRRDLNSNWTYLDLDREIELRSNQSVSDIFTTLGEESFRKIEVATLKEVIESQKNKDLVVSLGAGFRIDRFFDSVKLDDPIEVIWIQRVTDQFGRVFLDRPRLEFKKSALAEFMDRAQDRIPLYQKYCHYSLMIPEGIHLISNANHPYFAIEQKSLFGQNEIPGGSITILPDVINNPNKWKSFVNRYKDSGVEYFELRDDLVEIHKFNNCLEDLDGEKFIFSFRKGFQEAKNFICSPEGSSILERASLIDWPAEFNEIDFAIDHFPTAKTILSVHEAWASTMDLERLELYSSKFRAIKLSPLVDDWNLIFSLYKWQQQNPSRRIFLPRSSSGRWEWLRLLMKGRQLLNFFSETKGSAPDQPNLLSWILTPPLETSKDQAFAAVLGSPVLHSYTPIEHFSFFGSYHIPIFRIDLNEVEFKNHLSDLIKLGLKACAVTSPLKEEAFRLSQVRTQQTSEVGSANTLFISNDVVHSHNTDIDGLRQLFREIPSSSSVAVWGGGGTLMAISKFFKSVLFYSSRSGQIKTQILSESTDSAYQPDILIWAAPRRPDTQLPPTEWNPKLVVDLNYTESSMGRDYALKCKAKYISGEYMFIAQAAAQRDYWRDFL